MFNCITCTPMTLTMRVEHLSQHDNYVNCINTYILHRNWIQYIGESLLVSCFVLELLNKTMAVEGEFR